MKYEYTRQHKCFTTVSLDSMYCPHVNKHTSIYGKTGSSLLNLSYLATVL